MRKIFVMAIAIVYMAIGLWDFVNTSWANLISTDRDIKITIPFFGILSLLASLNIFRLRDIGRKVAIALLWLNAGMYAGIGLWIVFIALSIEPTELAKSQFGFGLRSGYDYEFSSIEGFLGFMLAYVAVNLLVIWFLSQKETKEIFTQTSLETGDVIA